MEGWKRTFYVAWLAQFLSITGFSFVLPFLPFYIRDELGVRGEAQIAWWAGVCASATAIMLAVMGPIWGALADRYGPRSMVLRSMFGGAIVLSLMGLVQNVHQLALCRALQGVLTGTMTACTALVASVAPRSRSGYALGMIQAAVFVGVSFGPLFGGFIAEYVGYRPAFSFAGVMLLAGGLLVWKFAEEAPRFRAAERGARASGSFQEVLTTGGLLTAVFVLFSVRFANSAPGPVFPLLVQQVKGGEEGVRALTGMILFTAGLVAALSVPFLGGLSDRYGHRRPLVAFCVTAAAVSALYGTAQNVPQLFALRVLFGLAAAGLMPAANALIRQVVADHNIGKAYGVTASLSSIGMALGPLTGGFLVAATHVLWAPFLATSLGLIAAAALVMWRVPGRFPPPAPAPARSGAPLACTREGTGR